MKNLFLLFFAILTVTIVSAQTDETVEATPVTAEAAAEIEFKTTEVDYGTIEQNSDPYRVFEFTNTGEAPLIIKSAKGSCGCTVPTYPKEPILPGESGEIKVRYDTKRIGSFSKSVTLTTNATAETVVLRIRGKVNQPAPAATPEKEKDVF